MHVFLKKSNHYLTLQLGNVQMANVQIVNTYAYPNLIFFAAWDDLHRIFYVIYQAEPRANGQKARTPKTAVLPSLQTPVSSSQHSLILPEPTPYSLYPNDEPH